MRKVMLATPTYDGRVDCEYAYSLVEAVKACAAAGIDLRPVWWPHEALVQHARNMLVTLALEAKVDAILFADADQEWDWDATVRLLQHDADVVGYPVRRREEAESYNVRLLDTGSVWNKDDLWEVDGVGTGFLKLSRKALLALWHASEAYEKGGQKTRMIFDVRVFDGKLVGEDVFLCAKLTDLGFPIYLDPSYTVAHKGAKKYTGDFKAFIAKVNGTHKRELVANER